MKSLFLGIFGLLVVTDIECNSNNVWSKGNSNTGSGSWIWINGDWNCVLGNQIVTNGNRNCVSQKNRVFIMGNKNQVGD